MAFGIEERRSVFERRMMRIIETTAVIDEASKNAIEWAKMCLYGIMMSQFFCYQSTEVKGESTTGTKVETIGDDRLAEICTVAKTDPEVETVSVDEEDGELHTAEVPRRPVRPLIPG